jgi:hypothetical protein
VGAALAFAATAVFAVIFSTMDSTRQPATMSLPEEILSKDFASDSFAFADADGMERDDVAPQKPSSPAALEPSGRLAPSMLLESRSESNDLADRATPGSHARAPKRQAEAAAPLRSRVMKLDATRSAAELEAPAVAGFEAEVERRAGTFLDSAADVLGQSAPYDYEEAKNEAITRESARRQISRPNQGKIKGLSRLSLSDNRSAQSLALESSPPTIATTPKAEGERRARDPMELVSRSSRVEESKKRAVVAGAIDGRFRAEDEAVLGDDAKGEGVQLSAGAIGLVSQFENERRATEGVPTQIASGYWANTYVPGDPMVRWLQARLQERNVSALSAYASGPLLLDAAARAPLQPFDAPMNSALDVFLSSDRAAIDGAGRMIVQVGLQATKRRGGARPAMNIGLVLNLHGTRPAATQKGMRAVVTAFSKLRDDGDQFSITAAGRAAGIRVAGDDFRHGPLSIALRTLFDDSARPTSQTSVVDAVRQAAAEIAGSDGPKLLGASAVVLVTDQPFGDETEALTSLAHQLAVGGISVSVIGIGGAAQPHEIERIVLAGQGSRRLLEQPADADAIVRAEIMSLSRVVARAIRLRIRLAAGVELVRVLGSQRLDAMKADRVREAERSIDVRVSRELGIEADRGEDEDGIQIVIPAFYSGDAHVILLDVIAEQPGPLIDVRVRYKDLTTLGNATARASLAIRRGPDSVGPLQRNVLGNLLAYRLSEELEGAGQLLRAGDLLAATERLAEFRELLIALQSSELGLGKNPDLIRDIEMLGEYVSLMRAGALEHPGPREHLAEALQLSGYLKTRQRPPSTGAAGQ